VVKVRGGARGVGVMEGAQKEALTRPSLSGGDPFSRGEHVGDKLEDLIFFRFSFKFTLSRNFDGHSVTHPPTPPLPIGPRIGGQLAA
jgi:hypothetical protein